jgi:nucleotide-binding universal stress UspA family protein
VVAIDGSHHAQLALAWAIDQARQRGGSVHVVHVWQAHRPEYPDDDRDAAETLLLAAIEAVPDRRGASISSQAIRGDLLPALLRASAGADVLVLGDGGLGTSRIHRQCVEWARCSLAVVAAAGAPEKRANDERHTPASAARSRTTCTAPGLRLRSGPAARTVRVGLPE